MDFKENHYQQMYRQGATLEEIKEFKAKMNRHILKLIREEQAADEIHNMNSFKSKKYFDVDYDLDALTSRRKGKDYEVKFDRQLIASSEEQAMENKRVECELFLAKMRVIVKQSKDIPLSETEEAFLALWESRSLKNTRSKQPLSSLSGND